MINIGDRVEWDENGTIIRGELYSVIEDVGSIKRDDETQGGGSYIPGYGAGWVIPINQLRLINTNTNLEGESMSKVIEFKVGDRVKVMPPWGGIAYTEEQLIPGIISALYRDRNVADVLPLQSKSPAGLIQNVPLTSLIPYDGESTEKVKRSAKRLKDLIVPAATLDELKVAMYWAKNRKKINKDWSIDKIFEKGTGTCMLFYGPPGTGKTLGAEILANELKMKFHLIRPSEILNRFVGVSEGRVAKLFKEKNSVICIDEADSFLSSRNNMTQEWMTTISNQILGSMESFQGIVVFTTNRKKSLDFAIQRRLTFIIRFPKPDVKAREAIWNVLLPPTKRAKNLSLKELAKYTLAGGDIKNVVLAAIRKAVYKNERSLNQKRVLEAILRELKNKKVFQKKEERKSIYASPRIFKNG